LLFLCVNLRKIECKYSVRELVYQF